MGPSGHEVVGAPDAVPPLAPTMSPTPSADTSPFAARRKSLPIHPHPSRRHSRLRANRSSRLLAYFLRLLSSRQPHFRPFAHTLAHPSLLAPLSVIADLIGNLSSSLACPFVIADLIGNLPPITPESSSRPAPTGRIIFVISSGQSSYTTMLPGVFCAFVKD